MGKKPLIGAVGLWVGLSLTGCSDCSCFHRSEANKYQGGGGSLLGKSQDSKAWSKPPESVAGSVTGTTTSTTSTGVPATGGAGSVTPAGGAGFGTGGFGGGVDPAGVKAPGTTAPAATGGPSVSDAGTTMPGRNDGGSAISVAGAPAVKPAAGLTEPAGPAAAAPAVRQTSLMPLPSDNNEPVTKLTQPSSLPSRPGSWADQAGAGLSDSGSTPGGRAPLAPPPVMSKTMLQNSTPLPGGATPPPAMPAPLPPPSPDAGAVPPPVATPGAATDLNTVPPPSFGPPPVPSK
jgi:hypothetical protein